MITIELPNRHRDIAFVLIGAAISAVAGWALIALESPLLVVAPIAAVMSGLLAIRLPGVVLAAYLYIPFYKGVVDPYLPFDLTVVLAVVCLALAIPLLQQEWDKTLVQVTIVWTALLAVVAVGSLYALDTNMALTQLMYFALLVYLPSFLGIRVVREGRLLDQFLIATITLSMIVSVAGITQLGGLGQYERVAAMSNTIGTARSAFLLLIILPAMISIGPKWLSVLGVAALPLGVFVVIASGSRGPLILGILTILIVQLIGRERLGRKVLAGIILFAGSLALIQLPQIQALFPQTSIRRIEILFEAFAGTGELDNSSANRIRMYDLSAEMFLEKPLLGYGTAGFEAFTNRIPELAGFAYPHNLFLQIAAEFGVVGLVVTVILVSRSFSAGLVFFKDTRVQAVFGLTLFAFLNAMVSNSFYDNRWMWGMLLMLAAASVHRNGVKTFGGKDE